MNKIMPVVLNTFMVGLDKILLSLLIALVLGALLGYSFYRLLNSSCLGGTSSTKEAAIVRSLKITYWLLSIGFFFIFFILVLYFIGRL